MGNTILVWFRSVFVVPVGLWAMSWHRPHVHGLGVGFSQAIAAMGDRAEHDRTVGDRPSGGIVLKQADRLAEMGLRPDGDAPGARAVSVTSSTAIPLPGSLLWSDPRFLTVS